MKVWVLWELILQPVLTKIQTKITLESDSDNNTASHLYSVLSFLRHSQKHCSQDHNMLEGRDCSNHPVQRVSEFILPAEYIFSKLNLT